ncbi:MAG: poly-beta-hydroxybutyrate-responsive repressor [Dehalococcoidia bacterium]|nr:poly-beta-hydroxybutyrate-responsive repressor [Dehalococcoidia bacterium]MYI85938.1 poly-beta-hydroxybutyrate-responsive repressor [Dehalococcoidia bacterium]
MAEGSGRKRTTSEPRLHGEMLATSLLAFLKGCNAYGYQLTQQLSDSGLPQSDSGTVYRALRQLEGSGFVSSFWDTSDQGPARRMYSLTAAGELFLRTWIEALNRYQEVLTGALAGFDTTLAGDDEGTEEETP